LQNRQTMPPNQSMMPFINAYWPHLLAGLFVYVLVSIL
jgi:hypothetical protein